MDQNRIGKMILDIRKQNNLTQAEFAARLICTPQAVSKWENGRGIPDIETLNMISKEFSVDLNVLINGSKISNHKKRNNILIIVVSAILICILILILVLKKNDFNFSTISSSNEEFSITGVAAYTSDKKSIYITNIKYQNADDSEKNYVSASCSLYEIHDTNEKLISTCGNLDLVTNTQYSLSELLNGITLNVDDYTSNCKNLADNELYLIINAKDYQNKIITYKIPLTLDGTCEK